MNNSDERDYAEEAANAALMRESAQTASRGDVYVSRSPGTAIDTVVLIGAKHVDLSGQQARALYECLGEVLGVES